MKIHSFAFLLLASIIMQLESALNNLYQKQPSREILRRKMCSENMQQIYRRKPMPKYDLLNLHLAWVYMLSCKFAAYFQNTLS